MTTESGSSVLFEPIDISPYCNAPSPEVDRLLRAEEIASMRLLPSGSRRLRGIPFELVAAGAPHRWIWVSHPVSLPVQRAARYIVFAHACPLAADEPSGTPEIEFMARAGEELARFVIVYGEGDEQTVTIRRRFEVSEWTNNLPPVSFTSVGHAQFREVSWRGPHAAQGEVGWGPPGSSSMAGFPGVWGMNQAGITDDHAAEDPWYSIYALRIDRPGATITAIRLEPPGGSDSLQGVLVGGITMFHGEHSPLGYAPARTLRISGLDEDDIDGLSIAVDLGVVGRRRRALETGTEDWTLPGFWGWGSRDEKPDTLLAEVAAAPDATITVGDEPVRVTDLEFRGARTRKALIETLPPSRRRVHVRVVDDFTGDPTAARVHFRSADGRYLPPDGHRVEVNPGLMEDYGADLLLGTTNYAYVPGEFDISLPEGPIHCEITKGFEHEPMRTTFDAASSSEIDLRLARPLDFRRLGWVTADTHVHFVSPTTALLEARAEGVNMVHVLAIQVGNLFTNVADFAGSPLVDEDTETSIWLGSENRQPFLGHISLLNTGRPIFPFSTGGASTSHLGDAVTALMADWADRCREQGGFVVASHFPFPYGEIVADIVAGKIDAVEVFGFGSSSLSPRIRDWYRFLNAGYRVPAVGGTDKMSAGTPIGAVRTYAHIGDQPATFDAWTDAVRAGRTFVSSGPLMSLSVEGREPGEEIALPGDGGLVSVSAEAVSVTTLSSLEIVVNGIPVARTTPAEAVHRLRIEDSIRIDEGSWIAARCGTPHTIWSAFPTAVAAHTSPVYVTCGGRNAWSKDDVQTLQTMLDGGRAWAETMAVVETPEERGRFVGFFTEARRLLDARSA